MLLQSANFYLFKPGAKPADLKNAKFYIDEIIKLSNQLKIKKWQHQGLLLLGKYYDQANNHEESKKCFLSVITDCRKQKDKKGLAEALDAQGTLMSNLDPEKEKILNEAITLYASLGMKEKRIENYMKITAIYFWGGKIKEAKKRLYQNLVDLRKIGFTHQQFAETTIAYVELAQSNTETALYYSLKSVKRMEAENDYTLGDLFYMRLGDVYNKYGHHQEALDMYKKSIEIGKNNINTGAWYKSYFSAVAALSLKGKTKVALGYIAYMSEKYQPKNAFEKMSVTYLKANCYEELRNDVLAEKYFKETAYYAGMLNTPEMFREVVNEYIMIALFYIRTKRVNEAKIYSEKAFTLIKRNDKNYNSQLFQLLLYKNDSINGNHKGALQHYKEFKRIEDSLHGVDKNKQIDELKIQYETVNKEQKIKLLNDHTKLQESELKKSKLLNNVSIWSLVLLLIVIGLLYNRYRLKQRNHHKLELKEREIKEKNVHLMHLLDEKEWLLKEVHHRVKNNLQTVISLLNSQSAYLNNDMALSAIRNSQHRIHSMSLIHQKLYSSENIATINMPNYIKELAEYLKESFSLGQRIRFDIKVDALELDVAQAVPIGLILNEAITNAIKYAFPENRVGMITIVLQKNDNNEYLLMISDNGIGIDITLKDTKTNSFGMSLIKGLSDDLEGEFSMENNNGTTLKIVFKPELPINKKYVNKSSLDTDL